MTLHNQIIKTFLVGKQLWLIWQEATRRTAATEQELCRSDAAVLFTDGCDAELGRVDESCLDEQRALQTGSFG
jgi:hypothetical protein